MSVTDLVSPAWCELQYFYTLSKHGRKKRTPAMKQGTKVHETLEAEIHITVPVEVTKKEDSWGLRIWNIIQGLRTLRDTGRTRELEIWGTVGGEIVNGIIDELSYECPDPKLEQLANSKEGKKSTAEPVLPEYQTSIADFFQSGAQKENGQSISAALSPAPTNDNTSRRREDEQRIYITDVKTRGSSSLPSGSSIKPTILQLHLYHHMLENLAQGNFALIQLAERYSLDTKETFSDSFIVQIGSLNQDIFEAASSQQHDEPLPTQILSSQDSMDLLLRHNNLSSLWDFMITQFRQIFLLPLPTSAPSEPPTPTPQSTSDISPPSTQPTRLSPILTAEYLSSTYRHAPGTAVKFLGRKSFIFNPIYLRSYLEDNLAWWRGERSARGVELQEAWKCRSCDFRDDCEWIHERDKAALDEVLERKKIREIAGVEGGQGRKSNV
jgi:exonuclease V